jgi:Zn-dependent peptidase ImmA (M78 family)
MNRKKKYDTADWSRPDAVLAAEFGVTRQAIAAARKVRGIAPAIPHGGKRQGAGAKSKKEKSEK